MKQSPDSVIITLLYYCRNGGNGDVIMPKTIIASDSSCDLSKELIERYNVHIQPYSVIMGDDQFRDGVDVSPDDIYAYHDRTGKLARTAALNVAENTEFFEGLKEDPADEIVFFTISSQMSGTNQYARTAAEDVGGVYVIDSKNLSTGVGLSVIKAAELAEQGMSASEIADYINNKMVDYINTSFIIDSLEYLHKGGRCSALSALGANLLKLKPCIEVKKGVMGVGKKYRGRFEDVLKEYTAARLADADNIDLERVFVTHAGCKPEVVETIAQQVKNTLPYKEVLVTRAGATVSVHCGANTLGVLFVQKTKVE